MNITAGRNASRHVLTARRLAHSVRPVPAKFLWLTAHTQSASAPPGSLGSQATRAGRAFSTAPKAAASPAASAHGVTLEEVHLSASQRLCPPFATLQDLMVNVVERYASREALGVKKDGKYTFLTYAAVGAAVDEARAGLANLGVQKGDMVAVISRNRLEWVQTAYGGYGLGAVNVPMYEQQKESDWKYCVADSGAQILVVGPEDIYHQVLAWAPAAGVRRVICCDLPPSHPDSFAAMCAAGRASRHFGAPLTPVQPADLATLIYTSGTTGTPKGVMLSHGNLAANVKQVVDHVPPGKDALLPFTKDDRSLAFLPWAHSYGQMCELHCGLAMGASSGIAAGAPGDSVELLANIQEVQPTVIFSVPTLFKKLYDGVHAKIANEPSKLTQLLMQRALTVGAQVAAHKRAATPIGAWLGFQHRFLDKAVLAKMRAPLGGKLTTAIVAGAPTPVPVVAFVESLGLVLTEGYGLTETSPVLTVTFTDPTDAVLGSVGRAVPRTQLRLVDPDTLQDVAAGCEGELWVSGPQVMQGYWNKPAATAEVIVVDPSTGQRWFRTGDLVTMVGPEGQHLKITGRSKDQYKLENGKYVAPAPIEQALSMSKFVSQCVLYGSGKPYNVAVVVPEFGAVADELGLLDWYDPAALCRDPNVVELLHREARATLDAQGVKKYEQPRELLLVAEPFSAANEMLTPKLSIRKPNVVKAYKAQLDALYNDK